MKGSTIFKQSQNSLHDDMIRNDDSIAKYVEIQRFGKKNSK